jgi:hypothetical protein
MFLSRSPPVLCSGICPVHIVMFGVLAFFATCCDFRIKRCSVHFSTMLFVGVFMSYYVVCICFREVVSRAVSTIICLYVLCSLF